MTYNGISESKGQTRVQCVVTVLCSTSILTYGLQWGWMSPVTKVLQSEESPTGRPLTDSEISWIASAPSLADVFGVLIFLQIVDRYGRKICVMVVTIIEAMSWIVTMLPASTTSVIVARVFCGIAGGGCYHVVPMYVKEIAQDSIKGTLSSIFALSQSTGILLIFTLGGLLDLI